jgi:hypothetical protein
MADSYTYDVTRSFMVISHTMRTVTALISFVASTTIAFVILKVPHGLSSSYRRILLCMSIADVMQDLSIILGPFVAPQDTPDAFLAIGNTASCTAQGFLLNVASATTPMYTFGLSFYFLMRVKYGMSREDYAADVEWKWHTVTLFWNLVGNLYAIFTKSINATRAGSLCTIESLPLYCSMDPELYGECIRGEISLRISAIVLYIPGLVSFCGMSISLGILTWHVFVQESKKQSQEALQEEEEHENEDPYLTLQEKMKSIVYPCCERKNNLSPARIYRKEMLTQSCLYIFGYLFTYTFLLTDVFFNIAGRPCPDWSHMAISMTWPLGGFINILIYTRPKIALLRMRQPQLSWIKAFRTIILAGAEVPDEESSASPSSTVSELRPSRQHFNTDDDDDDDDNDVREGGEEVDAMKSSIEGKGTEQLSELQARKKNMIPSSFLNRPQLSKNIEYSSSSSSLHPSSLWSEAHMNSQPENISYLSSLRPSSLWSEANTNSQPGEHQAQGAGEQCPQEQETKRYNYY